MSARRRARPLFKACRRCHALVPREATRCPICGSSDFSENWEGAIIVLNVERSRLSKKLEIEKAGRYALRVR